MLHSLHPPQLRVVCPSSCCMSTNVTCTSFSTSTTAEGALPFFLLYVHQRHLYFISKFLFIRSERFTLCLLLIFSVCLSIFFSGFLYCYFLSVLPLFFVCITCLVFVFQSPDSSVSHWLSYGLGNRLGLICFRFPSRTVTLSSSETSRHPATIQRVPGRCPSGTAVWL